MAAPPALLALLIDDYISWFVDWSHACWATPLMPPSPPERFAVWHKEATRDLRGEQPALEKLVTLHDQLHTLAKLVAIKAIPPKGIDPKDQEAISAKYLELIKQLRRFEQAFVAAASSLDPLTGLRTRQTLFQDLERELSRAERSKRAIYLTMMDIDHFKKINDTYGHENGDRVLTAVANHIGRNLRAHDDAYRMGGEEFLLCLKETDATGSQNVIERLRKTLAETPVTLSNQQTIHVSASFGLVGSEDGTSVDALLQKADEALYRAKQEGRNRLVTVN
jgi:diguanylate cyclase (GGDEF)-like protein